MAKCITTASAVLASGESIVRVVLGMPQPVSHADYLTRFKVYVGKLNGNGTGISEERCFVVKISSNSGNAQVDPQTPCQSVPDLG